MNMRFALTFIFSSLCFVAPAVAAAQGIFPERLVPCKGTDCTVCDLATLAQNILNAGIFLAVFLSGILFAYAGFLYVTTVVEDQTSRARGMFTNVVLGLVIILVGWIVVDTVMKTFLGGGFGPWNSVCSLSL